MSLLRPTVMCDRVTEINPQLLQELGVKALLLDVDNTITSYVSKEPLDGSVRWAHELQKLGYTVYIVSNNYRDRVSAISKKFGLPFVSFALKPFPVGFAKARRTIGVGKDECLVVGDQVFTDILGANLGGMKSVLLTPIETEKSTSFKIRRYFESKLRPKYENLSLKSRRKQSKGR
jgi:HAD superfamily phosphatase (TIGR01668 family)